MNRGVALKQMSIALFICAGSAMPDTHAAQAASSIVAPVGAAVQPPRRAEFDTRITAGAYTSTETFTDPLDGQARNDFAAFSSRFFVRGRNLGEGRDYEFTLDLRDKHDFFDKLDRELLELKVTNTFQARQLSVKRSNEEEGLYFSLGRFPLWEAGSANVDGGEVGYRWTPAIRTGAFVGFNPERADRTDLQFNRDATVGGLYLTYVPKSEGWIRHFHGSTAFVAQSAAGHLDRAFFFGNAVYQWGPDGQLVGLVYLDFVPRVYVQTAHFSWLQGLAAVSSGLSSSLSVSAVDVIQYSRRQSVLELLAPSPYKEAYLEFKQNIGESVSLELKGGYGVRSADAFTRSEIWFGPSLSRFFTKHLSGRFEVGRRRDFVSTDALARGGLGYYSNSWEITLDQEFGVKKGDDGLVTHPRLTELGVAYHFSKELYGTAAIQNAVDERVSIFSTFFRMGYRFGSKGIAPMRDGAPPRGKL